MRSVPYLRNTLWKVSNIYLKGYENALSSSFFYRRTLIKSNELKNFYNTKALAVCFVKNESFVNSLRNYSKKKKSKKAIQEQDEEESDADEDESFESLEDDIIGDNFNIISKSVPSMRIDTVAKAAFNMTKKKVEKEFYASNLRLNGMLVLKKSMNIGEGDEVDVVKGYSPDNDRFLLVDRVIVKGIGKITSAAYYPIKMQVFKGLTIENYADPWVKSNPNSPD